MIKHLLWVAIVGPLQWKSIFVAITTSPLKIIMLPWCYPRIFCRYQSGDQNQYIYWTSPDNIMDNEKWQKDKQWCTKYYTENSSNTNPTKSWVWARLVRKGNQFLLHMWHPSCYSFHKQVVYIYNDNKLILCHECQNKNSYVTI